MLKSISKMYVSKMVSKKWQVKFIYYFLLKIKKTFGADRTGQSLLRCSRFTGRFTGSATKPMKLFLKS